MQARKKLKEPSGKRSENISSPSGSITSRSKQPSLKSLKNYVIGLSPWHWVALFSMLLVWTVLLMPFGAKRVPTAAELAAMPAPVDEDRVLALKKVNKHLQYLEKKKELNEMDAELRLQEMALQINTNNANAILPKPEYSYERLNESNQEKRIYEDLKGDSYSYDTPMTPEERINANLEKQRWAREYEDLQTRQYIEEFINNARDQGYDVKINDKLEVVEVIRIPTNKTYKGLRSIRGLSSQ